MFFVSRFRLCISPGALKSNLYSVKHFKALIKVFPWERRAPLSSITPKIPSETREYFLAHYKDISHAIRAYNRSFDIKGVAPDPVEAKRRDFEPDPLLTYVREFCGTSIWHDVEQLERTLTPELRKLLDDRTVVEFLQDNPRDFQLTPEHKYFSYAKVPDKAPNGYQPGLKPGVALKSTTIMPRIPILEQEILARNGKEGWHSVKETRAALSVPCTYALMKQGVNFKAYLVQQDSTYKISSDGSRFCYLDWSGSVCDPITPANPVPKPVPKIEVRETPIPTEAKAPEQPVAPVVEAKDLVRYLPYVPNFYVPLKVVESHLSEEDSSQYFLQGRAKAWKREDSPFFICRVLETISVRRKKKKELGPDFEPEVLQNNPCNIEYKDYLVPDEFVKELEYVLPSKTYADISKVPGFLSKKWKLYFQNELKWSLEDVCSMYDTTFDVRKIGIKMFQVRSLREETPEEYMFRPTRFRPLEAFSKFSEKMKDKRLREKELKTQLREGGCRPIEEVKNEVLSKLRQDEEIALEMLLMRLTTECRNEVTFYGGLRTLMKKFPTEFHISAVGKRYVIRKGDGSEQKVDENPFYDEDLLLKRVKNSMNHCGTGTLSSIILTRMPLLAREAISKLYGSITNYVQVKSEHFRTLTTPEGTFVFLIGDKPEKSEE